MTDTRLLSLFRENISDFLNELIDKFPEEGDLIVIKIFLETQVPTVDIMNIFNFQINSNEGLLRKMIKERNENFFLHHNLFDIFGKDKVGHFKRLWLSDRMTKETKETIWLWVDTFVRLGDTYMKFLQKQTVPTP